jgi:hypothetical protein
VLFLTDITPILFRKSETMTTTAELLAKLGGEMVRCVHRPLTLSNGWNACLMRLLSLTTNALRRIDSHSIERWLGVTLATDHSYVHPPPGEPVPSQRLRGAGRPHIIFSPPGRVAEAGD